MPVRNRLHVTCTRTPSHTPSLFPDPFPLLHMFADLLNATGFSQLQSRSLVPEEEAGSEELEDYY